MTRTHSGSLVAGGLNWDSLPLKLFAGGNAKFWNPADIDFSRDRADWERLTEDERDYATRLCAQFIAGEEAVTEDIQPFMAAMRAEGRLGDEMYLTQFAFEEAKHTQVFRLWLDAVGITDDLHGYLDDMPSYRTMFYEELPDCLNALSIDPSPAAQIRASVTYNHIVEGMLALTGYYAWHKICVERGILPGMQELVRRIGDDERRHMAWGTFTCRRHVAADDANWAVFETRMNELMPLGLRLIEEGFALYDPMPFDLFEDEFMQYAADKGMRRFGTINSARGRPLGEIDLDYSPVQLEDTFADEDEKALAGVSPRRSELPHPHGLGVAERADAQAGEFAAVAGSLDAAEPEFGVGHRHPVDEDLAGLDVVDEALLLGLVVGPGVGPQPEGGGVGDLDGFVDARGAVHRGDRAEDLFGVERHVLGDVGDHRRRVEPARPVGTSCRRGGPSRPRRRRRRPAWRFRRDPTRWPADPRRCPGRSDRRP